LVLDEHNYAFIICPVKLTPQLRNRESHVLREGVAVLDPPSPIDKVYVLILHAVERRNIFGLEILDKALRRREPKRGDEEDWRGWIKAAQPFDEGNIRLRHVVSTSEGREEGGSEAHVFEGSTIVPVVVIVRPEVEEDVRRRFVIGEIPGRHVAIQEAVRVLCLSMVC
jgi:hypothetical protein